MGDGPLGRLLGLVGPEGPTREGCGWFVLGSSQTVGRYTQCPPAVRLAGVQRPRPPSPSPTVFQVVPGRPEVPSGPPRDVLSAPGLPRRRGGRGAHRRRASDRTRTRNTGCLLLPRPGRHGPSPQSPRRRHGCPPGTVTGGPTASSAVGPLPPHTAVGPGTLMDGQGPRQSPHRDGTGGGRSGKYLLPPGTRSRPRERNPPEVISSSGVRSQEFVTLGRPVHLNTESLLYVSTRIGARGRSPSVPLDRQCPVVPGQVRLECLQGVS